LRLSGCSSPATYFGIGHLGGDPGGIWGNALLAQDDYRQALSFVAEKDLELEGAVLIRLARFFLQVAKVPAVYDIPLRLSV